MTTQETSKLLFEIMSRSKNKTASESKKTIDNIIKIVYNNKCNKKGGLIK